MDVLPVEEIEDDLARMDRGIRQLKVQYDQFFAGALPCEPTELRRQLDRLFRRYANAPLQKYQHRYHLATLTARYNSFQELWGRSVRALEEGERPAPAVAGRAGMRRDNVLAACKVTGTKVEAAGLKKLYEKFMEARRKSGVEGDVPFAAFGRKIAGQARQLQSRSECDDVELRVIVENKKVLLKARPIR